MDPKLRNDRLGVRRLGGVSALCRVFVELYSAAIKTAIVTVVLAFGRTATGEDTTGWLKKLRSEDSKVRRTSWDQLHIESQSIQEVVSLLATSPATNEGTKELQLNAFVAIARFREEIGGHVVGVLVKNVAAEGRHIGSITQSEFAGYPAAEALVAIGPQCFQWIVSRLGSETLTDKELALLSAVVYYMEYDPRISRMRVQLKLDDIEKAAAGTPLSQGDDRIVRNLRRMLKWMEDGNYRSFY